MFVEGFKHSIEWVERADVFLDDAEKHLTGEHFWLTCFESHQVTELYLKSLLVSITGLHPYTHDLTELLDTLAVAGFNMSEDVRISSELLTLHYTLSHYLRKHAVRYARDRAERCLKSAKVVIEWVMRVADP
ncbi:MAG: HEPN domain-containing protein [Zestosphaera sp.]